MRYILQAVLFPIKLYSSAYARKWLKEHHIEYISSRKTQKYRRYRISEPQGKGYITKHNKDGITFIFQKY